MFGVYENFPETVHGIALFTYHEPAKSIQQAILCAFRNLNKEVYDLGAITPYLNRRCEVGFEFGVAESNVFNFLDEKELDYCMRLIAETESQTLDFFFVVRCHNSDSCKRVPLRFDYHVLRLTFQGDCLEMRIRHEKGPQRIPLGDLIEFITKQINAELSQKRIHPLVLAYFEKVIL